MLLESTVVLTVASLVSLAITGDVNPYFACTTKNSYDVLPNESDEIMLNNCSASTSDEIIGRLRQSQLRGRPLHLNTIIVNLTSHDFITAVVNLDLSYVGLSKLDLRIAERLKRLNLTTNRFRSLTSIRLPDNVTLNSMDVSYNRLSALRSNAIPSTVRLSLRSNVIMKLEVNLTLPDVLLELDLTRNEIENVSLVKFSSSRLTVLNLSINLINAISTDTFARLPALQFLLLECNKIVEIEPSTFDSNSKLIELNLRDNNIFMLKKGIFDNLFNLKVLDISKNRLLRLIPDNIRELNSLVHFSMSENTKLCRDQRKCDLQFLLMLGGRLRVLKVSGLGMQTFPVMLTTSIRILDLSANKLTCIQTGNLENFPFLEVLDLSDNIVDTVEKDVFSRMEYLQELYLQNNRLTRVPKLLPPSLSILRLDGNRIRTIFSTDLNNLPKLSTLRLNSNAISSIESNAFRWLSNLRFLEISDNPVRQLRVDTLEGVNTLHTLYATDLVAVRMNATHPRYFPISELPHLRYLNLSRSAELAHCFLLDYPVLATVKQLEVLDLDYINLTQTPSYLRKFLPRLRLLSLYGNPINCSDHSFSEWKEPYRLGIPRNTASNTELTVRVIRRSTQPLCDRITIQSRCGFTANCLIISKDDFWSNIVRTVEPARVRRKFSVRSLTDRPVVANITRWNNFTTTNLLPTTQQTIKKTTTFVTAKLPTKEDIPVPFSIHSEANSTSDGHGSFFDWFPSLNNSSADRARMASAEGDDDEGLENTHLGLFIFLFMCTFILLAFGSLVVSTCVQTRVNEWLRRHRISHSSPQNLPYMEISSISTFIDNEIHLN